MNDEPTSQSMDDLIAAGEQVSGMELDDLRALGEKLLALLQWAANCDPGIEVGIGDLRNKVRHGTLVQAKTAVGEIARRLKAHLANSREIPFEIKTPSPFDD